MNNLESTPHYAGWQQWLFWALWLLGLVMAGYTFIGTAMALLSLPLMGLVMAMIFIVQLVMLVLLAVRFFKRNYPMRRLFTGLGRVCAHYGIRAADHTLVKSALWQLIPLFSSSPSTSVTFRHIRATVVLMPVYIRVIPARRQ